MTGSAEGAVVPHCAADFAPWRAEFLGSQAAESKDSSPAPFFLPACTYSTTQNNIICSTIQRASTGL